MTGSRSLQDRFDTRALADRIDGMLVSDTIATAMAFIEGRTCSSSPRPTPRGAHVFLQGRRPGFVRVVDEHTLAFPNYDGNGMYLSTGNVLVNPDVGMLFIDFERGHRIRWTAPRASTSTTLATDYPEAQFVVRVRARTVYPNCPRYIHRYELVERSRFVPRSEPGRRSPSGSGPTGR